MRLTFILDSNRNESGWLCQLLFCVKTLCAAAADYCVVLVDHCAILYLIAPFVQLYASTSPVNAPSCQICAASANNCADPQRDNAVRRIKCVCITCNCVITPNIHRFNQQLRHPHHNCARQQNICAIPLTRQYFTKTIGLLYVTHCMGKDE